MKRRDFLATGIGAATAMGLPGLAAAQDSAIPYYDVPQQYQPRYVRIKDHIPPGEIHVDPTQFALYWTLPGGEALRYTVGIGRPGLYESGEFYVGAKKEWPGWVPTPDMVAREPERYAQYADGLPGGLDNPLGARALYLFTPEKGDTFLRIHGTNDPATIAKRVSSGCARLVNSHLIDLYNRVPMDTRVVLYPPQAA